MSQVEQALDEERIWVVYQPIVELSTGKVFGHEALARSSVPEWYDPPTILAAAIQERMCGRLGRALRAMASKHAPNQTLFINIHPNEFDEGWLVQADDAIFSHQEPVYVEITESVPLSHFRFCQTLMREIRVKGIFLAVDDLGSGYSNLKYIAELEPDVVKLDIGLIAGLPTSTRQRTLVTSIVRLCEELGARTVAEGIETPEELAAVIDTGATYGQGFHIARPASPPPPVNWKAVLSGGTGPVFWRPGLK